MRPDKTDKKTAFSCPSYISKPGAELFGIVNKAGYVEYLHQAIRIDQTFVDEARKGRTPESRFRFSGKCIEGACQKWNAEQAGCGLVDEIIERIGKDIESTLQHCAIRSKCRWFHQRGAVACANCDQSIRNHEIAFWEEHDPDML